MGRISIDDMEPGMVLASDITRANGQLLLGKGTPLAPGHLRVLKIWGIHSVDVEGASGEMKPLIEFKVDPSVLRAAEESTRKRFSETNPDHPFLQELLHICTLHRAGRMSETPGMEGTHAHANSILPRKTSEIPDSPIGKVDPHALVDEGLDLTSLPTIFMEISEVVSDPRSSAVHVADVISKDTSLSAKLLKIVNSAYYNLPSKIDTISRAVTIVGSRQLSTLALGVSVLRAFQGIPEDLVDMESFWKHSVTCGVSARMIASCRNIPNTERLFVAGLLHDIGRIILYQCIPDRMVRVLLQAKQTRRCLRIEEAAALGFDHARMGEILLKRWGLPRMTEQAVAYHHEPQKSPYPLEASIVHLSDILANALEMGTSGEFLVPPLIPEAWDCLGLEKEVLTNVIHLIERQVEEVIHHFFDEGH